MYKLIDLSSNIGKVIRRYDDLNIALWALNQLTILTNKQYMLELK